MKWLLIYCLSSSQWPDFKAVQNTYHRLPTWIEQSKDTNSWSTSILSRHHLIGHYHLLSIFIMHFSFSFCPHLFIFIFTVNADYLYVADTLSTLAIKPKQASVEFQDLLISCQIECMFGQNRRFYDRLPKWDLLINKRENMKKKSQLAKLCIDLIAQS